MTDNTINLPKSVTHITVGDKEVYLVGTAHISQQSVDDVRQTIQEIKPDAICIELCQGRYDAMTQKDAWQKMNIFKILKEKKAVLLMAQLIMGAFYRHLGEELGVTPGAEMLEGIKQSQEIGAKLILADRKIDVTLKRVWRYLKFWDKIKLMSSIIANIFVSEKIDAELIDKMKQQDQLEAILAEFTEKFPEIKRRLIDERDIYLSQQIRHAPGQKIVAVVGAGHIPGITNHIQQDEPVDELLEIPKAPLAPKIIAWGIPTIILAFFFYGFFKQGTENLIQNIYIWVLVTGSLSAAFTAIGLAHPLTILSAFIAAPMTTLNPYLAAGMISSLVQAWIKTPTVADFEILPQASNTFKGWWTNPVLKILVIFNLSNLGAFLGVYIAGFWIAARSL